ncbi:hypothetical protein CWI81_00645 [Idiomarina seosinensis]|uniref:Uncharacterized protein n=1 Tax=Idiomarina seosinensis TaxID=281739 RepID=A0A432ZGD7_9GAMM|nr:hypothetical protein CWI81_00645 [Idiomarina seosinensis]
MATHDLINIRDAASDGILNTIAVKTSAFIRSAIQIHILGTLRLAEGAGAHRLPRWWDPGHLFRASAIPLQIVGTLRLAEGAGGHRLPRWRDPESPFSDSRMLAMALLFGNLDSDMGGQKVFRGHYFSYNRAFQITNLAGYGIARHGTYSRDTQFACQTLW